MQLADALRRMASLKAQANGHDLGPWLGPGKGVLQPWQDVAACNGCLRVVYVLTTQIDGRILSELCSPKPPDPKV